MHPLLIFATFFTEIVLTCVLYFWIFIKLIFHPLFLNSLYCCMHNNITVCDNNVSLHVTGLDHFFYFIFFKLKQIIIDLLHSRTEISDLLSLFCFSRLFILTVISRNGQFWLLLDTCIDIRVKLNTCCHEDKKQCLLWVHYFVCVQYA